MAPISRSITLNYSADTDMLEAICDENNRDVPHLVGTATALGTSIRASLPATRERTVFRRGVRAIPTFMGATQRVTLMKRATVH